MALPRTLTAALRKKAWLIFTLSDLILIGGIALLTIIAVAAAHNAAASKAQQTKTQTLLTQTAKELDTLKHQNQYEINQKQQAEINHIHSSFDQAVKTYESLTDFRAAGNDTKTLDQELAQVLQYLSQKNYASADATLGKVNQDLATANAKAQAAAATADAAKIPGATAGNVPSNNTPPGSGLSRQSVQTDGGTFVVDIIAGDLNSTRVLVDTASDSDCSNDCPAFPLATYAQRSGAYAAINGSFFCPTDYPSCAGKTNSFDTLLMNKSKHYFNSDNNVYSNVPLVAFFGSSSSWHTASSQWGRDTGVDSVIAMQPGLIFGGSIAYSDSSDPKFNSVGARDFIANKGNIVYIGSIHNATMGQSAKVLKAMGMDNAINLDEGGSTALWYNGSYIAGPGRNIPNAVLFVRK